MIKFDKPAELNGLQLIDELKAANIKINDYPLIDENGEFWLDITKKDEAKTEEIVNAHVGIDRTEELKIKRQEILDRIGLTDHELKLLLG